MSTPEMIHLPNGDLWRPPVMGADGNYVERKDTLVLGAMPNKATMTPDVAAILMADLQRQADAAKSK